jgi:Concanavalin A-like lectin/glucanases superfamily
MGPNGNFTIASPVALNVVTGNPLTLTFNHPIKGLSASVNTFGRFERTVTLTGYVSPSDIGAVYPPAAQVTASAFDHPSSGDFSTTPLQIRSEGADMSAAVIQFSPSVEYFSYAVTNLRIESGSAPDPSKQVPTHGLKQWLRADSIYDPYSQFDVVGGWPDQSGNHADASGTIMASAPDGPNCAAVVTFNGKAGLSANLPINGWHEMTVFLVSQSAGDIGGWWENQPLFWGETSQWGTTFFTPSQSNVFFRFGTEQVNNQPIYARPVNVGGDYTLTTAIHDGSTDRLYLNSLLALKQSGKRDALSGVSPVEQIGAGLDNTFFTGAIGEILVYDRALSDEERAVVEHYLMKKFGLF